MGTEISMLIAAMPNLLNIQPICFNDIMKSKLNPNQSIINVVIFLDT